MSLSTQVELANAYAEMSQAGDNDAVSVYAATEARILREAIAQHLIDFAASHGALMSYNATEHTLIGHCDVLGDTVIPFNLLSVKLWLGY